MMIAHSETKIEDPILTKLKYFLNEFETIFFNQNQRFNKKYSEIFQTITKIDHIFSPRQKEQDLKTKLLRLLEIDFRQVKH